MQASLSEQPTTGHRMRRSASLQEQHKYVCVCECVLDMCEAELLHSFIPIAYGMMQAAGKRKQVQAHALNLNLRRAEGEKGDETAAPTCPAQSPAGRPHRTATHSPQATSVPSPAEQQELKCWVPCSHAHPQTKLSGVSAWKGSRSC